VVRLPAPLRPLFPYLKPAYVQATRMVAPATQAISRARGGALPTGCVGTLAEAAATTGGRCVTARPAERIERPPLLGLPAGLALTDPSDGQSFDRVDVAELPGGRVLGPHRAVISGRGDLVQEVSWYFGTKRPREHPLFVNPFPGPAHHVDGRLGVLGTRGDGNYYHFLMDVISRPGVLAQAPEIEAPRQWYVPMQTRFQRELLELAGIEACVDAGEFPHVSADVLVVPAPPAMSEKNPPWVIGYLRDLLLPRVPAGPADRLVYVTRGPSANNRTVRNDAEVLALLQGRGFELVDPGELSVAEQIRIFAEARIVVATHGAALANLAFASPGSAVVELFPRGVLLPDFWRLASGVPGLTYRYVSAFGPRGLTRQQAIVRDIDVDIAALAATLDELG
jgi:capsular polysaccharide biosynthesis protein